MKECGNKCGTSWLNELDKITTDYITCALCGMNIPKGTQPEGDPNYKKPRAIAQVTKKVKE